MNGAVGIEGGRVVALVDGHDLCGVKYGAVGIEGGRRTLRSDLEFEWFSTPLASSKIYNNHVNNFRIQNIISPSYVCMAKK
jgi:hypothetical protein